MDKPLPSPVPPNILATSATSISDNEYSQLPVSPSGHMKRQRNYIEDENEMAHDVFVSWKSSALSAICSDMSDNQRSAFLFELLGKLPTKNRLYLVRNVYKIANIDFIGELPPELALHVLKYVDAPSLFRCTQVSKFWNKLINSECKLWKNSCIKYRITLSNTIVTSQIGCPNTTVTPPTGCPNTAVTSPNTASCYKTQLAAYLAYLSRLKSKNRGCETRSVYASTSSYAHSSRTLGITANSSLIYSGGDDRHIRVWDRSSHTPVSERTSMGVSCLDCTEDIVAAGQFDGCVTVYDSVLSRVIVTCSRHMGPVYDVACSADSSLVVSGSSDCTVRVWEVVLSNNSYTCLHVFRGHETMINKLLLLTPPVVPATRIFSLDIAHILVYCVETKRKVGSLKPLQNTNKQEYFLPGLHCSTEIRPDSSSFLTLVCGSSAGIYFWDVETCGVLRVVQSPGYVCNESLIGVGSALMLLTYDDGVAVVDTVSGENYGTVTIPQFNNANCAVWVNGVSAWLDGGLLGERLRSEPLFVATTIAADIVSYYLAN